MHFNTQSLTIILLASHLIVPAILLFRLFRSKPSCVFDWIVSFVFTFSYNLLFFLAGYWVYAGFYLRYLLAVLTVAAGMISFLKTNRKRFYKHRIYLSWMFIFAQSALTVLMWTYILSAILSTTYDVKTVSLSFPLKNGTFAVIEGGNGKVSSLMNSHYTLSNNWEPQQNESMKYALDIGKLNTAGMGADGLFPNETGKYYIFGQTVYSPCDGEITSVTDGMEDKIPFSGEHYYSSGNTLVIRDGDVYVTLVHLEKGSIRVSAGDKVKTGQPLALVGNSGWSSEPHLHMQATRTKGNVYWEGESIPILFGSKFPVKNSLFFVK